MLSRGTLFVPLALPLTQRLRLVQVLEQVATFGVPRPVTASQPLVAG